jgi:MoaA/NifB/PqqE/SkfB family radical SAM enzyme
VITKELQLLVLRSQDLGINSDCWDGVAEDALAGTGSVSGLDTLAEQPETLPAAIPSVDWWIISQCNFACDFCYGPVPGRDPVSLRADILAAIKDSSAEVVTFCGGEPLLVRGIDRYARDLAGAGKRTVLNTNGSLLRRRVAQGLELAFSAVGLSIDGSTQAIHGAMRGDKADLEEVLRAARLVSSTPGLSLKLATVVSKVNQYDLPFLAELVRGLNPDIWRLYQYSRRGNKAQRRHAMSEAEFSRLADEMAARVAPVPTAPSSEELNAGCLIVDLSGNVIQPTRESYIRRGNCLEDPIDRIWSEIPTAATIIENKRWLSVLRR